MHHIGTDGEDIRPLSRHERQALEARDIGTDPRVKADGQDVDGIGVVAADQIEARLVRLQQPFELEKRLRLGEDLDGIVSGAAREMRDGRVREADYAVDNFVERPVSAAGVQPYLFAAFRRFSCNVAAVAGLLLDADLIGKPARTAGLLDLLAEQLRMVIFSRSRVYDKNMLHGRNLLLSASS